MKPITDREYYRHNFPNSFISRVPNATYREIFICQDELRQVFPTFPKTATRVRFQLWEEKPDIPHDRLRQIEIQVRSRGNTHIPTWMSVPATGRGDIELDISVGCYMSRKLPAGVHKLWLSYEATEYDHHARYVHEIWDWTSDGRARRTA